MLRRNFVKGNIASIALMQMAGFQLFGKNNVESKDEKPSWLLEWIKIGDQNIPNYKPLKVVDPNNKYFGGYMNEAEIPNPHSTSSFIDRAATQFSCPESVYFQSKSLLLEIDHAAKCLLKFQHSDGTVDLLETNFHSTPDVAFVLENIVPAYSFIKNSKTEGKENVLELLKIFLLKSGKALVNGGIHTPNHRWVVSAALTRLNELFPNKLYTNRIVQWLAEHIDIDPDGQYTEKSTNTYSPIVNRSLIIMARGLNKPELLEPVRKNLLMTLYYVHPNGEVVTEASNRQDKGTISNMARYYYNYRYMALLDNNGQFAAMAKQIEQTSTPQQLAGYLEYFLGETMLWKELPASKNLPTNYAKAFPYSGVVRIRRSNWDSTILSNNASFLTFHKGNSVLQGIRIASSFFGKGQFQSEKIEQIGNTWVLQNKLEGPYYQPLNSDKIDPNGDWDKMPREGRKQSEVQKLNYKVEISEQNNGLEIEFSVEGTDNVPITLELIFRAGGKFSEVEKWSKKENAYLFSSKSGSYTLNNDSINFENGRIEHKQLQLRGALPASESPTVYLTGFTPFLHKIKLF
jgi:hypothetical protein